MNQFFSEFELERKDLPADTDYNLFGLNFTVIEADGTNNNICTLNFPLMFGEKYYFEVRNEGEEYQIWANIETTAVELKDEEVLQASFDISNISTANCNHKG